MTDNSADSSDQSSDEDEDPSDQPADENEDSTGEEKTGNGLPEGVPDPDSPPDFAEEAHVLLEDELVYPTFSFDSGDASHQGFDLARELDREEMRSWLDSLAGGLASHDVAVEGEDTQTTFGVAPDSVQFSFDPHEDNRGRLSVTFELDAVVVHQSDADERPVGARGGRGFIPREMLTVDRDPGEFRCYNWIDDPTGDRDEEGE